MRPRSCSPRNIRPFIKYLNRLCGATTHSECCLPLFSERVLNLRFQILGNAAKEPRIENSLSDPHRPSSQIFQISIRGEPLNLTELCVALDELSVAWNARIARNGMESGGEGEKRVEIAFLEAYESRSRGGFPPKDRSRLKVAVKALRAPPTIG